MQRSSELEDLVRSLYKAVSSGDGAAVDELVTGRDGLLFIGTDPSEWFADRASVRAMVEGQAGAGVTVESGGPEAYEEGTVGWTGDQGVFVLPDGSRVPFRLTAVFHRENGAWKLVQEHCSVAMANEDVIGAEL